MNKRTRIVITIHKALRPWDEVDRLYVSWKGGKRLASIEDSVDTPIQTFKDYIKNAEEDWL